ncbi:MAG: DHH family phosphoesterase [Actinomycetota bacterium]|nr:DHH family phosphoesterase [Actinomycetota bacterium]
MPTDLGTSLDAARAALSRAVAVVPHTDADGLAAGAIALRHRREPASAAVLLGRGETPFGIDADLPGGLLAILDWGVRPLTRPALLIDHHAPEAPLGSLTVSSYGEQPEVPTAALMRRLIPEAPAWLAAVGAHGDLGDTAFALPECAGAAPKTAIRELVSLVNAPRRLPDGPVRTALALLVEHDQPKAALADSRIGELREAKQAWRSEFNRVVRTAPRVSGDVALIRFDSRAQVHPLVATTWARRLTPRMVLVANDGYLPGRVNFAVRGGEGNLRRRLREALPGVGGEFAHGHDRATGGSLAPEDFERLLENLDRR